MPKEVYNQTAIQSRTFDRKKPQVVDYMHAIKKDGTVKVRDNNQLKKVKERPQHLCPTWEKSVSRSSADYCNFDIEGSFVTETGLDIQKKHRISCK